MMIIMEQSVEWLAGGTEVRWENLSQCHFVYQKSHMTWPWLDPGPRCWKPALVASYSSTHEHNETHTTANLSLSNSLMLVTCLDSLFLSFIQSFMSMFFQFICSQMSEWIRVTSIIHSFTSIWIERTCSRINEWIRETENLIHSLIREHVFFNSYALEWVKELDSLFP
jgi:hypothetical protein